MPGILCTADRLFDGTGAAAVARPAVRVTGDRVPAVGRDEPGPPGTSVERHAFPGCTIRPGLIDTHVHLVFCAAGTHEAVVEQVVRESDDELVARALGNARAAVRAGLTTVRDCGGRGRVVQEVR